MGDAGWTTLGVIAAGSAAGGVLRHLATEAITRIAGGGFPWGTLTVNVVGSLAIGVCVALSTGGGPGPWGPAARHATMTGLLGGFTTFSTFSVQTMALIQQGQWLAAGANALASVVVSVLACGLGYWAVSAALRY
jgi:CrcB protein